MPYAFAGPTTSAVPLIDETLPVCPVRELAAEFRSAHPMQRAELVAVGVAQIGKVEFAGAALAHTRRIFATRRAMGDAGRVPRVGLLGRATGEADGAAIGRGCRLAVDRLGHGKNAGFGKVENAMAVDLPRRYAEPPEHHVIERLGFLQIVRSDHHV